MCTHSILPHPSTPPPPPHSLPTPSHYERYGRIIFNNKCSPPKTVNRSGVNLVLKAVCRPSASFNGFKFKAPDTTVDFPDLASVVCEDVGSPGSVINVVASQLRDNRMFVSSFSDIVSRVLLASVHRCKKRPTFAKPVSMNFNVFKYNASSNLPLFCTFFDEDTLLWSQAGVTTFPFDVASKNISCETNHLTSFGVLLVGMRDAFACTF